jgi:hypothetical protein
MHLGWLPRMAGRSLRCAEGDAGAGCRCRSAVARAGRGAWRAPDRRRRARQPLGPLPTSSPNSSARCPVAISMTWTALPITSAGRLAPLGVLGMRCLRVIQTRRCTREAGRAQTEMEIAAVCAVRMATTLSVRSNSGALPIPRRIACDRCREPRSCERAAGRSDSHLPAVVVIEPCRSPIMPTAKHIGWSGTKRTRRQGRRISN